MKIQSEQLYQAMMSAINYRRELNAPDMVESCFWVAGKYWELLKRNIDKGFFGSLANEVYFFRNIKPRFTSQIQFYSILAEVLIFVPEDPDKQFVFWRNELKRYKRFYEKNKDFVTYYESNAVYLDSFYFIKVKPDWNPSQPMLTYDSDKNYCSSHDHLVRGFLANKMFYEYAKEKLAALKDK